MDVWRLAAVPTQSTAVILDVRGSMSRRAMLLWRRAGGSTPPGCDAAELAAGSEGDAADACTLV